LGMAGLGIFAALSGVVYNRRRMRRGGEADAGDGGEVVIPAECCGQHAVCERENLFRDAVRAVEYYDDEELDEYRGVASDRYPGEAVEKFREVLYTLRENEVAGWLCSLGLRGVVLPEDLRDETLLMMNEK